SRCCPIPREGARQRCRLQQASRQPCHQRCSPIGSVKGVLRFGPSLVVATISLSFHYRQFTDKTGPAPRAARLAVRGPRRPLRTATLKPIPRLVAGKAGNNPAQSAEKTDYQKTGGDRDSATD